MQPLAAVLSPSECPSPETLSAYLLGRLSDEDIDAVHRHVDRCVRCSDTLRSLEPQVDDDPLVHRMKRCLGVEPAPDPSPGAPVAGQDAPPEPATRTTETGLDAGEPGFTVTPELPLPFGRYSLLEKIGEGGMGTVYKALQQEPKRLVALKLIKPGAFEGEAERARFRR
jgi:hypothetical protein